MEPSSNHINVLVDFASQIELADHKYIKKSGNVYSLTETKNNDKDLKDLVDDVLGNLKLTPNENRQIDAALAMIHSHLQKKITGLFSYFIPAQNKAKIQELLDKVKGGVIHEDSKTEGEARLKFYAKLPQELRVKQAASSDIEVIKAVSKKIWDRVGNSADYEKYMKMFFEGEHILFEEEGDNFEFYDELKEMGYLRGSSHYDHGTTDGKTGGPVPENAGLVNNPQYEIQGPQVKALLLGRVKLALAEDSTPIFGQTIDQFIASRPSEVAKPRSKNYTFMQTEWAPDSDSLFTSNYWKHRVFSFCLYAGRKVLGCEKPNVGPYGYGHADKGNSPNSNPTVIPIKKKEG